MLLRPRAKRGVIRPRMLRALSIGRSSLMLRLLLAEMGWRTLRPPRGFYRDFQRRMVAIEACVYPGGSEPPPNAAWLAIVLVVNTPPT